MRDTLPRRNFLRDSTAIKLAALRPPQCGIYFWACDEQQNTPGSDTHAHTAIFLQTVNTSDSQH